MLKFCLKGLYGCDFSLILRNSSIKKNQMTFLKNTLILLLFTSYFCIAQTENKDRYKGINVGHETRILDSKINEKHYKLYINLPANYNENTDKTYPVFYMLDGQWDFSTMVSIYGSMSYDGLVPDFIIVGISYAGDNPTYGALRTNDFTPTILSRVENSGDAKKFTTVLRNEIIPFIDKNYRTSPENRTLAGTSYAGLYTHYALFNSNNLFYNYIICNPSYWYDNGWVYKNEQRYYENNQTLNANVYLVSGSLDAVSAHHSMVKQIISRRYQGLNFKNSIVKGFGHSSAKAEGYSKGVLHSFKIKKVELPEKTLQKYIGIYKMDTGQEFSIITHNKHLAIQEFMGEKNIPIYAISNNKFSLNGTFRAFEFNTNEHGEIITLTIQTGQNDVHVFKRIK